MPQKELHRLVEPHGDSVATRIVSDILLDLTGRRGLRHQWDSIDDDIKTEIIETWVELARARVNSTPP